MCGCVGDWLLYNSFGEISLLRLGMREKVLLVVKFFGTGSKILGQRLASIDPLGCYGLRQRDRRLIGFVRC